MKIVTSWVSMIVVAVLLVACIGVLIVERNQEIYPEIKDFDFSLTFGPNGRSSLNTFTGTITKDLVSDGVIATDYVLPDRERRKIERMLYKMDILAYPRYLNIKEYTDHIEIINFHIVMDGKEHSVMWIVPWDFDFEDDDRLTEIHGDFIVFVNYVKEIVFNSDEFKALPKAKGGYL